MSEAVIVQLEDGRHAIVVPTYELAAITRAIGFVDGTNMPLYSLYGHLVSYSSAKSLRMCGGFLKCDKGTIQLDRKDQYEAR